MGRPKGFVMSAEQKTAMKAGRAKARAEKASAGIPLRATKVKKGKVEIVLGKPVLRLTGKEKDAFAFYTPIRDIFRQMKDGGKAEKILREITDKQFYENINWIISKLSNYVSVVEKE